MEERLPRDAASASLSGSRIVVALLLLCSMLTSFVPQMVLGIAILVLCCSLFMKRDLYLAYPFMLFYYAAYGTIFGVSVYRLYTLMVALSAIVGLNNKTQLPARYALPLIVYIIYALLVISEHSAQTAIFSMVDVVCCLVILMGDILKSPEKLRNFFKVYVLVAIAAAFTGFVGGNTVEVQESTNLLSRFCATFEDPNYMGFFYTIGVFSIVTLKPFSKGVRLSIVIALYLMIFATASVTAILVNIVLWLFFLVITKKLTPKTFLICIVVIILAISLYEYALNNPDMPILGSISQRIDRKLKEFIQGDIDGATTDRTALTRMHLKFFQNLPLWNKLFGGFAVNTYFIHSDLNMMAHNEYVDLLLNVGLVGTVVILGFMIHGVAVHIKRYIKTQSPEQLCMVMCKLVWLAYAAALTVFMDFRFMLPFFI